jgi:hypothetical protein
MKSSNRSRWRSASLAALLVTAAVAGPLTAQTPSLEEGFRDPPNSARPRVWWHWMNGNISEDGIRKDIEWMARVGIGGMQSFDAAVATPQIVDKRLVYMDPAWKKAFRFAAEQAEKHGLELATAASPGWSETGGPWVKPEDGMKKVVWSEMVIPGGRRFAGKLPPIPGVSGSFQDLEIKTEHYTEADAYQPKHYSADLAVFAYRLPGEAVTAPKVSVAGQELAAGPLSDGVYLRGATLPRGTKEAPTIVEMTYPAPQTIRSIRLFITEGQAAPVLEAADAAGAWRKIAAIPLSRVPTTVSFAAVTARRFRLVLTPVQPVSLVNMVGPTAPGVDFPGQFASFGASSSQVTGRVVDTLALAELSLTSEARVNDAERKAGFAIADDYYALDGNVGAEPVGVPPADVVNLTGRMAADGSLAWTPPRGTWRVIRMGYSLTGTTNHPATPEATGLEVDKFDGAAVRNYMATYLKMYRDATGPELFGRRGMKAIVTDSIEVGPSNWTPKLIDQFKRLRGYDPTPWLPTLTGVVIESRARTDAFLYDYRRTLADLMASQHYAEVARASREQGLTYYSEALESARITLGDDMAMRQPADIPMAMSGIGIDMQGAASVAHVYGQNLVAAESLTNAFNPWASSPADLRMRMDFAFASGVNRPVIHTSVHQPVDDKKPGLALQVFGQYFNRHEAWAEMAKPWVDYLARNSFMLQQGRNHADVAYFYGEEAPLVPMYLAGPPKDAPVRYAYDFVNPDVIDAALKVEGTDLITPGGARYRLLYLGGSSYRMTVGMLRRLAALVEAGAVVVGQAPRVSPSLQDDPAEFAALVTRLWGDGGGATLGKGRVVASDDVEAVLASLGAKPDFSYAKSAPDSQVLFVHRQLADGEIYYLVNRTKHDEMGEARFRVTGKVPEIWRADSGRASPVSYRIENGATVIPLNMMGEDSAFVVFRKPATAPSATVPVIRWTLLADIGSGSWDVAFQPGRGAPASAKLPSLASLSDNVDPQIRYFSGEATYRKVFALPKGVRPGQPLMLDLGQFGDIAEVRVNGVVVGSVWRQPHQIDIGKAVTAGTNQLEIKVANLWVNRLIGDAQPGASKIGWTSTPTYLATAQLRPSGLIGPVRLLIGS